MDEQSREIKNTDSKHESEELRISGLSAEQRNSSCDKSERRNRRSLIQVMSVDGSDANDSIYEYYLLDDVKKSKIRSSNNSRRESNGENSAQSDQSVGRRRSSTSKIIGLGHQCQCDENNCLGYHCSCYNSQEEICLLDSCCSTCIQMKNEKILSQQMILFQAPLRLKGLRKPKQNCTCSSIIKVEGHQNHVAGCPAKGPHPKDDKNHHNIKSKIFDALKSHNKGHSGAGCSCKKSHCLKKYCACFANNKQCTAQCECVECCNTFEQDGSMQENYQDKIRYSRANEDDDQDEDIDKYFEDEDYEGKMMPSSMEFQSPDMSDAYHY